MIVLLTTLGVFVIWPDANETLAFDRTLIEHSQWWRVITGHFVHLSVTHWLGNTLGVLILWRLFATYPPFPYPLLALLFCTAITGIGLYRLAPDLSLYVGFSGVLHGLLLLALLSLALKERHYYIIVLILMTKVGWELSPFYDPYALQGTIGGRVEVRAHALGLIAGSGFYALMTMFQRITLLKRTAL